jgi:hypothetical protein
LFNHWYEHYCKVACGIAKYCSAVREGFEKEEGEKEWAK